MSWLCCFKNSSESELQTLKKSLIRELEDHIKTLENIVAEKNIIIDDLKDKHKFKIIRLGDRKDEDIKILKKSMEDLEQNIGEDNKKQIELLVIKQVNKIKEIQLSKELAINNFIYSKNEELKEFNTKKQQEILSLQQIHNQETKNIEVSKDTELKNIESVKDSQIRDLVIMIEEKDNVITELEDTIKAQKEYFETSFNS